MTAQERRSAFTKMKMATDRKRLAMAFGTHAGSTRVNKALNAMPIPIPANPVRSQPANVRS